MSGQLQARAASPPEPASASDSAADAATAAASSETGGPLLPSAQAAALLDEVVYEQVLECVDLDALVQLERSLVLMIGEIDQMPEHRACELARSMIDRAVVRIPDDARAYAGLANLLSLDCELCEEEAREARGTGGHRGNQRRHPRRKR
jgi:hypothetical protein